MAAKRLILLVLLLGTTGSASLARPSADDDEPIPGLPMIVEAHKLLNIGEDEKALAVCDLYLKKYPPCADIYFLRTNILTGAKRYPEALSFINDGIKRIPNVGSLYFSRAKALEASGKLPEALADCDKRLKMQNDFECRHLRARILRKMARYQDAVDEYTKVIVGYKLWTDSARRGDELRRDYEARGKCYMQLKQYQKAADDFSKLIYAAVTAQNGYKLRAEAFDAMGQKALAHADRTKALTAGDDWAPPSSMGHR